MVSSGPIISVVAAVFDLVVVCIQAFHVTGVLRKKMGDHDDEGTNGNGELRPRTDSLKRIISTNSV